MRFKKMFVALFFVAIALSRSGMAQDTGKTQDTGRVLLRLGYMQGSGGAVGVSGSIAGGAEYEFRHNGNTAFSISGDLLMDRSTDLVNRALIPALANFRWYSNADSTGFFLSGGAGAAFPLGINHGGTSFAWQGSLGYMMSSHVFVEGRYIGRSGQPGGLNNQFVGGMIGYSF